MSQGCHLNSVLWIDNICYPLRMKQTVNFFMPTGGKSSLYHQFDNKKRCSLNHQTLNKRTKRFHDTKKSEKTRVPRQKYFCRFPTDLHKLWKGLTDWANVHIEWWSGREVFSPVLCSHFICSLSSILLYIEKLHSTEPFNKRAILCHDVHGLIVSIWFLKCEYGGQIKMLR